MKEKTQIEKFQDAARELGIDEADVAFEAALAHVAKSPKLTDDEIKALAKLHRADKSQKKQ